MFARRRPPPGPGPRSCWWIGSRLPAAWRLPAEWAPSAEKQPDKARFFLGNNTLEVIPGNGLAQVVAPPSVCDGVPRKWLPGLSPNECRLAEIPDDALQRLVAWEGLSLETIRSGGNGRPSDNPPQPVERMRLSKTQGKPIPE